jgi:tRNA-Thr(GGU) m(6)t(6)A37 methyltransferase TsaA
VEALDTPFDGVPQTPQTLPIVRGCDSGDFGVSDKSGIRPGELAFDLPDGFDAGLYFIGRIRTPFKTKGECPKNIAESTAEGLVEMDPRYAGGLAELQLYSHAWLVYWMDRARRDLALQVPAHLARARGTFALRSPVRPNPIAMAAVELISVEGPTLRVRNVDCIDGTPLLDIKPYFASIDSIPSASRPKSS